MSQLQILVCRPRGHCDGSVCTLSSPVQEWHPTIAIRPRPRNMIVISLYTVASVKKKLDSKSGTRNYECDDYHPLQQ
jgi:hypothetical protein